MIEVRGAPTQRTFECSDSGHGQIGRQHPGNGKYSVPLAPVLKEESQTMIQAYKVVIEHDTREGYVATFPEFAGCKAQAESLKALLVRIGETMAPYVEAGEPATTLDPGPPHRMAQA